MLLIKYSEIGVKGKNRYIFEDMLVKNIRSALKDLSEETFVRKAQGRIYVECKEEETEEAISALTKVFGIAWICPLDHYGKLSFEEIAKAAVSHMESHFSMEEPHTFKVNCRRADKAFPMTSVEVNEQIGEVLLDRFPNLSVDVHDAEIINYHTGRECVGHNGSRCVVVVCKCAASRTLSIVDYVFASVPVANYGSVGRHAGHLPYFSLRARFPYSNSD